MKTNKKCPFNLEECTSECALYVSPDEMNETVKNKLASLGVISRDVGLCSLKNISMCLNRHIFENTKTSSYSRS